MSGRHPLVLPGWAISLVWLALLAGDSCRLEAQPPPETLRFRHLTIADGLSQNTVNAITQDHRGFIWIGTKDGLNRYDGHTFLAFDQDPFDTTSLSDGEVTALFEDSRGTLWVGTRRGGLNRFDREREIFHRFPDGPRRTVTAIQEGADGALWIGTDGEGLFRLSFEEGASTRWAQFTHDPADPRSLDHDRVYAITVDRLGTVWVGTGAGLNRWDGDAPTAHFAHYRPDPAAPDGLIDAPVTALLEDRSGRLWIGSTPGLSVLEVDRRRTVHHYHHYRTHRYGWGKPIQMLEALDGRIWISTYAELMRFDPATGAFAYLRHDPSDPAGINSDVPTALFQDRSGVLWVGTNGFGLNIHDPKAARFHTFRRTEIGGSRISGFSVYTLFEDSRGDLWIDAGVLYKWNRRERTLTRFETSSDHPDDFGNTGVWSLLEDPTGVLWAGTYRGLYRYEIETGRYRQFRPDPRDTEGLPEEVVFGVHRDRNGALWVVTTNYLARLADRRTGRFVSYRYNGRPSVGQWTFPSLHEDSAGVFWFGSSQGLVRFDPRTETFRHFRHDPGVSTSLAHDRVLSILPDPSEPGKHLWIGTAGGGLDRFDLEAETFVHHTRREGLPNEVVYGILADEVGALWLSTNKGLSRFNPRTRRFRNYDAADGLQSNEFNSGAYYRSPSGELFFGGIYGFNYFRPAEVRDNPHVPEVVITGFRRGNRWESVRDSGTVLQVAISEADTLWLSHRDAVIAFEFAALDFSAPAKNRFAYRMVGLNEDWVESDGARSATYTNLPPGRYSFQVKASNNDGIWNERGAQMTIVIAPPWWRTWWAYGLFALLLAGTLHVIWRHELNRLRLKNRLDLERLNSHQLRELDHARSRFFANVSHEFRTPLTLTLGPLDDLRTGLHGSLSPAVKEQVELARRSAGRVLDLINQILELARLETGCMPLRARRIDLCAFVRDIAQRFAPLAERESLALEVRAPADPLTVHADPEHLEKVLTNLLSNALKFTPAGGAVRVTVQADAEVARVSVRDSGPGVPAPELERIFDRFHRLDGPAYRSQPGTGIGLSLARELAELHGGSLAVESEEGFGSNFTVTLPLGRKHLGSDQIVEDDLQRADRPALAAPVRSPTNGAVTSGGATKGSATHGTTAPIGLGHPAPLEAMQENTGAEEDVTTVLVVEDNPEVRAYLRRHLARVYRVLEAADGESGLELARTRLPDLVISDVMMPGMDGHALCRALKEESETDFIPIILLTARAGVEDRLAGLRERADDYLTKPFEVSELLARTENLIASRKRLRERFSPSHGHPLALHAGIIEVEPADRCFVEQVREVIEEHLGDETFSVEQLARRVSHSRGHLHRRLRALVDETPSGLIRRLRLERAAQLIEDGAGPISTIAYAVGFKSVAHFSNSFQAHFGVRPSGYAASRKGGNGT